MQKVHIEAGWPRDLETMNGERLKQLLRTPDDGTGRISQYKLVSLLFNNNVTPEHIGMATQDKSPLVLVVGVIANPRTSEAQVKTGIRQFYKFREEPDNTEAFLDAFHRENNPYFEGLNFERALRLFKVVRKELTM